MLAIQAKDMALYNRWMNQRLYDAFFKSIHGTLNHLLLGDKIWLGRFLGEPFRAKSLDQELHRDFYELREDREATDEAIIDWANSLTDAVLAGTLEYTSMVNPAPRKYEMWLVVAHFFNHQTHHRGQLTTLLSQFGLDIGVTDLLWLPEAAERNAN